MSVPARTWLRSTLMLVAKPLAGAALAANWMFTVAVFARWVASVKPVGRIVVKPPSRPDTRCPAVAVLAELLLDELDVLEELLLLPQPARSSAAVITVAAPRARIWPRSYRREPRQPLAMARRTGESPLDSRHTRSRTALRLNGRVHKTCKFLLKRVRPRCESTSRYSNEVCSRPRRV